MGGSDGVLKWGSERGWKRAPIGRSCVLSRSRYSGDGHAWLCGGFVFWKGTPLVTGLILSCYLFQIRSLSSSRYVHERVHIPTCHGAA